MTPIGSDARTPARGLRAFVQAPPVTAMVVGYLVYLAGLFLVWKAVLLWTPDQVGLQMPGHNLHIANLHHHLYAQAMEAIVLFPALFIVELVLTGWQNSSLRYLFSRAPSAMSDLACWLLGESRLMSLLALIMSLGVGLIGGDMIHAWIAKTTGVNLTTAGWPIWVQLPILFLIFSFFDYWNHRVDHAALFWPLHRFHHSAEQFCIMTTTRVHPAVFSSVISAVGPAAVLGAPPETIAELVVLVGLLRNVIHSRIDSNFGWIGRWVLQSPNHHRLHHVLDISVVPTGHFSLCPLWDRLFGTWRGEADQTLPIGVTDAPYRHGLWIGPDLWRDYMDFWKGWIPRRKPAPSASTSS